VQHPVLLGEGGVGSPTIADEQRVALDNRS